MKTIAVLRPGPTFDPKRFSELLVDEERAVWTHSVSGELREIHYNLASFGSVILVLETNTAERARDIIAELPLVASSLFATDIMATKPYDGLAQLFQAEHGFEQTLPEEWPRPV